MCVSPHTTMQQHMKHQIGRNHVTCKKLTWNLYSELLELNFNIAAPLNALINDSCKLIKPIRCMKLQSVTSVSYLLFIFMESRKVLQGQDIRSLPLRLQTVAPNPPADWTSHLWTVLVTMVISRDHHGHTQTSGTLKHGWRALLYKIIFHFIHSLH